MAQEALHKFVWLIDSLHMTDMFISYTLDYAMKLITQHTTVSTQKVVITHREVTLFQFNIF